MMTTQILEYARFLGASLAGIVDIGTLRNAPSYQAYGTAEFPAHAKSVLVLALAHSPTDPELDWWGVKGGTLGNQRLQQIAERLKHWLHTEHRISAQPLPYHIERGGVFLKDAAALAGLGVIGKNNLLITPEFGPRVRLRALCLDMEVAPVKIAVFSPCEGCAMPCRAHCPQQAFASGAYTRDNCAKQMQADEQRRVIIRETLKPNSPEVRIKYCRACELACLVGFS